MTLEAGARLGAYELVAPLGAGGMGEVWRGRDPRLGREVAIKVLPTHLSGDAMALARFEREARAVAALSHPHILAIHDFASDAGYAFTVTELLEGETLRARLADGPVPVRRAAEWGAQVARALAAAHDKKIVHRDIKPDNLFVTREGRIKVLDFGLALVEPPRTGGGDEAKTTGVRLRTDPGRLIGTVGYMSPEQVRGEKIDSRSDIFSLGCVLYEMVTGQRPFHRGSPADTLAAILLEDPPGLGSEGSAGGRVIPSVFARIVRHCLEKEPAERFQNARDLAFDLESLADATTATPLATLGDLPPAQRPRPRGTGLAVPLAALALGLALGAAGLWWALPREAGAPSRLRVITHAGNEAWPTVSPDGRLIAFASERDGGSRIWVRQMASGDEVALTSGVDSAPRFSPDGASLLFLRRRPDGGDLFRVATLGGDPRRAIPDAVAGDWSPDGRQIGFVRGRLRTRWTVGVAASDGGGERLLSRDHPLPLAQPRWSPDGRFLAVLRRTSLTGSADSVLLFDLERGEPLVLRSRRGSAVSSLAWAGASTLLLAVPEGAAARTPSSRLMSYELGSGMARTLLWVPYVVPSMEVMGDGRVVLTAVVPRQNLRELDLGGGGERWRSRGTTVDRQPVYSPDGGRVIFSSTRGGNLDLWALDDREGALQRLTNDPAEDWDPAMTPDGKRLLWSSDRTGHFEVWIAEADGRAARQLTRDGADAQNPTAAPGGWVVYTSGNRRHRGLWRVRLDGGGAERLVPGVVMHPEVSPDGRHVLYDAPTPEGQEVRVVRLADGGHEPFRIAIPFRNLPISGGLSSIPIALGRARWRPDGSAIAYVGLDGEGGVGIFEQAFEPGRPASGEPRPLVRSEGELITESHGFSPDGSRLLVSFIERTPNLVVAERVPGVAARARPGG